uniref:Mannose/sialic acid-binding lectin n=1 Tax=Polygonatum roseum TaxID=312036 RepID=Q5EER7_9ASPA|nr:mannose/sialic acid-binding lectin [Polygonatum roseum]
MAASSSPILLLMATIAIFGLMIASPCAAVNSLTSPNSLPSGHSLNSDSYRLIMQGDCNFVLYDSGSPVWASNTGGLGSDCRLTLHNNGNLVIYDRGNNVIWETKTNGKDDHYVLVLQQDRNVVIYGPAVWATGSGPAVGLTLIPHNATAIVHARAMLNK